MRSMRSIPLVCAFAALCSAGAIAAEPAAPSGVLALSSSASAEVTRDLLTVVLSTTREGPDAAGVQSGLKQALDAALVEARKAAKPGQLDLRTGNFSLHPRQAPPNPKTGAPGGIVGWQGSAELVLEGRDLNAIAQLAGRIQTLAIARVGYALSRELREQTEREIGAEAIKRFGERAADYAKAFGYAGYTIREVNVSSSEPPGVMPMAMARAAKPEMADQALPVEPGKGIVSVQVNGTVQMVK